MSIRTFALLSLLALLACANMAHAAQSYDNCSGFIDSLPSTISTQGVWCLRKDLATSITGGAAITIAANNVTVDCNDFKLGGLSAGTNSGASGIGSNQQNVTVRHCAIRGFYDGINLSAIGGLVEDNRLDNNLHAGIYMSGGEHNLVRRNRIYDTGGFTGTASTPAFGIYASADILDNTVVYVFSNGAADSTGIYLLYAGGHEVGGNLVADINSTFNGSVGIAVGANNVTVTGNSIFMGSSPSLSDTGISGHGATDTFCKDNIIGNFEIPMANCQDAGGNASH